MPENVFTFRFEAKDAAAVTGAFSELRQKSNKELEAIADKARTTGDAVRNSLQDSARNIGSSIGRLLRGDLSAFSELRAEAAGLSAVYQRTAATGAAAAGGTEAAGVAASATLGVYVGLAAAALAVEAAFISNAVAVAQQLAPLQSLSDKTGITAANLFKLSLAAQAVNGDISSVGDGFEQFSQKLTQAVDEPTSRVAQQLRALGINARDALRDPGQAFVELGEKIAAIENPVRRQALLLEFYGEQGSKLASTFKVLNENQEAFNKLISAAGGASGINAAVAQSAELTRQMGLLSAEFEILKIVAARDVLPALVVGLREVRGVAVELAPVFRVLGGIAGGVFISLLAAVTSFSKQLGATVDGIKALASGDFAGAGAALARAASATYLFELIRLTKAWADASKDVTKEADRSKGAFTGAVSAAKGGEEAARAALRALEAELRATEKAFSEAAAQIKRQYDERVIDDIAYTQRLIAEIEKRKAAILDGLAQEQAIADTRLTGTDRTGELQRIAQARTDAETKAETDIFNARNALTEKFERARVQRVQAEADAERAALEAATIAIEAGLQAQTITYEAAQIRLTEIALRQIEIRRGFAQAELENARNPEAFDAAQARLRVIEQEATNVQADGVAKRKLARERDLENERRYNEQLRQLRQEAQALRTDTAASFSGAANAQDVIRQRADIDRQIAAAEFDAAQQRREQQLRANEIDKSEDFATQEAKLNNRTRIYALMIAEAERFQEVLRGINRREQQDLGEADPLSTANLFGQQTADQLAILEEALGRQATAWERNRVSVLVYTETLRTQAAQAWARATNLQLLFTQAIVAGTQAYAQSGGSLRAAAGAIAAALAEPFIQAAKTQAAYHAAAAAGALAVGDFRGAFLHGAAAAGFAVLAGLGQAAIGAINGGGASTGAQAAPQLTGTNAANQQREDRIRYRDADELRSVTTIVIKHDPGMLVSKVENVMRDSYNNGGVLKNIVQKETTGEGAS